MTTHKTAESVSPRHPDKICDQISDAILDAYLTHDPAARVAIDVAGGHGTVFVTGEVTANTSIDITPIVHKFVTNAEVITKVVAQSREIALGVDSGGAGDQGIMVGYATRETEELLPLEVVLSRQLNQYLYAIWPYDGKTQITLQDGTISAIVASFQHAPYKELRAAVIDWGHSHTAAASGFVRKLPALHINPAGDWTTGGFDADAGLTGRKLAIDNYGPRVPLGGGAFSGKDPSKVDRSAAYMARRIAVDYLRQHNAHEVYVYLAYAIGFDQPLEATLLVDGITQPVYNYDLTPRGIIDYLDLQRPIYESTARYGHFGHREFSWEL